VVKRLFHSMNTSDTSAVPAVFQCKVACVVDMRRTWWLEAFIGLGLVCQLTLALVPVGTLRPAVRFVSYGVSMALLALLPGKGRLHPAAKFAIVILAIVGLSMLHPTTNSLLAGAAQAALHLAILAPLFWVARLPVDVVQLRRVMLILWAFHTASCVAAIIQVSYPGLLPQNLTTAYGSDYAESMQFHNASGELVFRPMGLSDVPGAASVSGFYAVLFGLGALVRERAWWLRLPALLGIGAGFTTLYLSQVRSMVVMLLVCIIALNAALLWAGERARAATLSFVLVMLALISYTSALAVGGEVVSRRFESLFKADPNQVYYENRGHFISQTANELLPEYPLGAGLGRWGMMNQYFGDNSDPRRAMIWVEIQWTGWLLDGGVPLILAYTCAIAAALWAAWTTAIRFSQPPLRAWAAVVLAYNIGALAMTFNYPFFLSQGAMELWLLNAALYSARDHVRVRIFAQDETR
jgi:hypothetical protein